MRLRHFIPLLLISAFVLMFLNTALLGVMASWSFRFMREEYGMANLIITRGFAVLASVLTAVLVVPIAFVSRRPGSLYGIVLAVLGLLIVINPMNDEALTMLRTFYPEYLAYVLACWLFWKLGDTIRTRKKEPQQTHGEMTSNSAPSAESEASHA